MHFIDLPRCIKPNSTSQAALYVWLWNFSGNKNCCCPGQTPWSIVSRNFSLSNLELSFDQTTQAFICTSIRIATGVFSFILCLFLYQEVWWGERWKVSFYIVGKMEIGKNSRSRQVSKTWGRLNQPDWPRSRNGGKSKFKTIKSGKSKFEILHHRE